MAHSATFFRGHGFWANDAPLQIWTGVLADELLKCERTSESLKEMTADWLRWALARIGGCVLLQLDDYVKTDEDITLLVELSQNALARLRERKEIDNYIVYLSDMTKDVIAQDTQLASSPSYAILIGETFVKLLLGQLDAKMPEHAIQLVNPDYKKA